MVSCLTFVDSASIVEDPDPYDSILHINVNERAIAPNPELIVILAFKVLYDLEGLFEFLERSLYTFPDMFILLVQKFACLIAQLDATCQRDQCNLILVRYALLRALLSPKESVVLLLREYV